VKNLKEPLVSIILSNYNGLVHLKECFDSLYNINYKNVEIIFIDNNSTDTSVEFIRENYIDVKIIQNKRDYGFSGANNIAASHAKGEYLVLLNIDTIVDKNWLTELVKVAETSNEIGIVVSKQYYYHDRTLINYAGFSSDKYLKHHRIGYNERDHKIYKIQMETFFAAGASVLIKREVYKKIGLFEGIYYAFYEDLDLSWRAWISGYKVIYAPKSFIYHKAGFILGRKNPRKAYLIERNKLRTILKNYQFKTILRILPVYVIKRFLLQLIMIIQHSEDFFIRSQAYIKAIFWNLFHIRSLIQRRKFVNSIRVRNDDFIFDLNYKIERFIKLKKLKLMIND